MRALEYCFSFTLTMEGINLLLALLKVSVFKWEDISFICSSFVFKWINKASFAGQLISFEPFLFISTSSTLTGKKSLIVNKIKLGILKLSKIRISSEISLYWNQNWTPIDDIWFVRFTSLFYLLLRVILVKLMTDSYLLSSWKDLIEHCTWIYTDWNQWAEFKIIKQKFTIKNKSSHSKSIYRLKSDLMLVIVIVKIVSYIYATHFLIFFLQ